MFWAGLATGCLIGVTLGIVVMGLLVASARGDDERDTSG